MKKINEGYTSLFEFLVEMRFPFTRTINKTFYYEKSSYPPRRERDQLIGAFQPIISIVSDIQDSIKPYKSLREALIDLLQPIRGLGNILRGLMVLGVLPFVFLLNTVATIFMPGRYMKDNLRYALSWSIDGLCSIARGIAQLITTPLTWVIRLPLRGLLTIIKGSPDFIENEEVQELVDDGNKAYDAFTMARISQRLHQEYKKSQARGQTSIIDEEKEAEIFKKVDTSPIQNNDDFKAYLGLFKSLDQIEYEEFKVQLANIRVC